jgi:hypothetical protein
MNFGLKSLSELPTLRDFQEIAKSEGEGDDENDSKIENGNGISPSLETVDKGNVEEEEEADIISEELRLETHVPS